jgi:hypothetical protein
VRISTPSACAERAIAALTPPVPFFAGGLGALECVQLEPLVEQVGRGLRDQLGDAVDLAFAEARAVLAELEQPAQVAPGQRGGVGRHQAEHRLDRLRRARHHP